MRVMMADMKYMFMTYQALGCILHKHHLHQPLKQPCVSEMKASTAQYDIWHRARADSNRSSSELLFRAEIYIQVLIFPLYFIYLFIFYQLEANHFTILQWPLSYIDMNQPWIHMHSPSRSPLPPPSPPDPSGSSQCTRSEHLSHASNLGW